MELSAEHKKQVEWQIVDIITASVEQGKMKEEEMSKIATFVLSKIDTITTQAEVADFLKNLSSQWDIFKGLEQIEMGEIKEQQEQQAIHSVEGLINSGNLDQALQTAKAAIGGQQ